MRRAAASLIGLSLALWAAANVVFFRMEEPRRGAPEALWAASLALFAIGAALLSRPRGAPSDDDAAAAARPSALELALLALVLAGGLAARVVALRDVPFAIHTD